MPTSNRPRVSAPSIAAPTPRVKKLESDISKAVTAKIRSRLGVTGNRKLPADVQELINSAATVAAESTLETAVIRDVQEASNDLARGSVLDRFDSKVADARVGLDHIASSNDVEKILKRRAEMLAAKKEALENAGFSEEQAMDIVLADIAARGH